MGKRSRRPAATLRIVDFAYEVNRDGDAQTAGVSAFFRNSRGRVTCLRCGAFDATDGITEAEFWRRVDAFKATHAACARLGNSD